MWVDMFPMDVPAPGPAIDISPRKPKRWVILFHNKNSEFQIGDFYSIYNFEHKKSMCPAKLFTTLLLIRFDLKSHVFLYVLAFRPHSHSVFVNKIEAI